MQLVRLLGVVEVGDGFLVALPRAVAWAAVAAGAAATIVQPELGDAADAVRRVAVGVGLVSILGAAGGLAWLAADATTAPIVPGAPVAAAVLTIAALLLAGPRLVGARRRSLAVRRDRQRRPADRHVRHRRPSTPGVRGARAARRHRPPGLAPAVGRASSTMGVVPVVATAGVAADETPAATAVRPDRGRRAAGLLECGPKRGGPLNAHDRQLLGALGREAALRLRTVSQADELEVRLRQIEHQAAEIAASRRASSRPRTRSAGASSATSTTGCSRSWRR